MASRHTVPSKDALRYLRQLSLEPLQPSGVIKDRRNYSSFSKWNTSNQINVIGATCLRRSRVRLVQRSVILHSSTSSQARFQTSVATAASVEDPLRNLPVDYAATTEVTDSSQPESPTHIRRVNGDDVPHNSPEGLRIHTMPDGNRRFRRVDLTSTSRGMSRSKSDLSKRKPVSQVATEVLRLRRALELKELELKFQQEMDRVKSKHASQLIAAKPTMKRDPQRRTHDNETSAATKELAFRKLNTNRPKTYPFFIHQPSEIGATSTLPPASYSRAPIKEKKFNPDQKQEKPQVQNKISVGKQSVLEDKEHYNVHGEEAFLEACGKKQYTVASKHLLKWSVVLVNTGLDSDWERLRDLQFRLASTLPPEHLVRYRKAFSETILSITSRSTAAFQLLADLHVPSSATVEVPLARYLYEYCRKHEDFDEQFRETRKILNDLREASRDVDINLMLPFMQSAVNMDMFPEAYKLVIDTCTEFGLPPTSKILLQAVWGFASVPFNQQDWSQIDTILLMSHDLGNSRKRPASHAKIVLTAVQHYAQNAPEPRVYDYLAYHIQASGLVPNEELLLWVYHYFFAGKDVGLALKWAKLIHTRFPQQSQLSITSCFIRALSNDPTIGSLFAMCKVLTYGKTRGLFDEDFSLALRDIVIEKLSQFATTIGCPPSIALRQDRITDTHVFLDGLSRWLSDSMKSAREDLNQSLLHASLASDLQTTRDILIMLDDYPKFLTTFPWWDPDFLSDSIDPPSEPPRRHSIAKWRASPPFLGSMKTEGKLAVFKSMFLTEGADATMSLNALIRETRNMIRIGMYKEVSMFVRAASESKEHHLFGSRRILYHWIIAASEVGHLPSLQDAVSYALNATEVVPLRFVVYVHGVISRLKKHALRDEVGVRTYERLQSLQRQLFKRWWVDMGRPDLTNIPHSTIAALYTEVSKLDRKSQSKQQEDREVLQMVAPLLSL